MVFPVTSVVWVSSIWIDDDTLPRRERGKEK